MVRITVITVTFNGRSFLEKFIESLMATDQQGMELDIVFIDNGSSDGTVDFLKMHYPKVRVLENTENNYTSALNLGIAHSVGEYVVIANNDATVHPNWLQGLLDVFQLDEKIGAVQSKLCFSGTNRVNSVGVQEVGHFYFADIGFDRQDSARYAKPREREYITGGSVMFRRACLEDVGNWDEDFILFMEDLDYSARCRKRGWKLWFSPSSIFYHHYHGNLSQDFCEYFCTRNRFFFVAKHFPLELANSIPTSHFYQKGEIDNVYRCLLHSVQKLCASHDTHTVDHVLADLEDCLPTFLGDVASYMFFSHLEVLLGLRRIRVGIFCGSGETTGLDQRYIGEMAAIMQYRYDVTFIFTNDRLVSQHKDWRDLDLSKCSSKIIQVPLIAEQNLCTPNAGMELKERTYPFDSISRETLNYDIFINGSALVNISPLSPVSLFMCQFTHQERTPLFHVDKYDRLVVNSDHTGEWVERHWNLKPTDKLYPPVNMYNPLSTPDDKEQIILCVSRFEISGRKKQVELITTFSDMCLRYPQATHGWKLMLVGHITPENTYFDEIETVLSAAQGEIEYNTNATLSEIKDYYRRASIFWHAGGFHEDRPEHLGEFGITTVEAMQNYCVPIVSDRGGQREIVEHGDSGFHFSTFDDLMALSLTVMADPSQCRCMAVRAYLRSRLFSDSAFKGQLEKLLADSEKQLLGHEMLPGVRAIALHEADTL
jgi:GT2 family glycosyltransferase